MSNRHPERTGKGLDICGGSTITGAPCRSRAAVEMTPEGPRCLNHDPGRRSFLRAMSIKGAKRSAKVRAGRRQADADELWDLWPLRDAKNQQRDLASAEDAATLASWAIKMLIQDRITEGAAHEISVMINAWNRAHGSGDLAKRVKEAEALIARLLANAKGKTNGREE